IRQPDLFIRLRPGKENLVRQKLQQVGINFSIISDSCLALPNASKIDGIVETDKEVVVQDYSSQRVGELIQLASFTASEPIKVWDSCAGSGGKSILVNDIVGKIDLTVSDVRKSILKNLEKRFEKAGIIKYKSFVVDLTQPVLNLKPDVFNLIVADVPCSGSGTWSRTPEQLYYFDENKIDEYAALQRKIVSNIITHLEPGGYLLYITCSVFKKENEDMVDFIKERFHLQPVKMELIKGYDKKADTMFAALLKKSL
ncbi:MAG: Fmu (Sun) domain-containing protein, partial [Bacteroidota bacterium]